MPSEPLRGESFGLPDAFHQLRSVALSDDVSSEVRALLRDALAGPLEEMERSARLAADALDGPDPEVGLLYILDAASRLGSTLMALNARIP
jgi:plasmid stability protein